MQVDLLCRVIDNYGDAGICWRLAKQLSDELGLQVALWIDQPEILSPWRDQAPDVQIHHSAVLHKQAPGGDLLIAALGAELPRVLREAIGRAKTPWLRYEYLTAESWIDAVHAHPSIKPIDRAIEWYFCPGFSTASGGLLREQGLMDARARFATEPRHHWLARKGLSPRADALQACLFGYPIASLRRLLEGFSALNRPVDIYMAESLIRSLFQTHGKPELAPTVRLQTHGWLNQDDFDRLLWSCDFNLVRGEESWVRAQWAGKPFIWQPYQQADGAHEQKLEAFLDRFCARTPAAQACAVRSLSRAMSGMGDPAQHLEPLIAMLTELTPGYLEWREQLTSQTSLIERLRAFMRDQLQLPV